MTLANTEISYRENNPRVNLVPLIDVIFTILIFLMVTSSFQAAADTSSSSGKPEINQTTGPSDYYLNTCSWS